MQPIECDEIQHGNFRVTSIPDEAGRVTGYMVIVNTHRSISFTLPGDFTDSGLTIRSARVTIRPNAENNTTKITVQVPRPLRLPFVVEFRPI